MRTVVAPAQPPASSRSFDVVCSKPTAPGRAADRKPGNSSPGRSRDRVRITPPADSRFRRRRPGPCHADVPHNSPYACRRHHHGQIPCLLRSSSTSCSGSGSGERLRPTRWRPTSPRSSGTRTMNSSRRTSGGKTKSGNDPLRRRDDDPGVPEGPRASQALLAGSAEATPGLLPFSAVAGRRVGRMPSACRGRRLSSGASCASRAPAIERDFTAAGPLLRDDRNAREFTRPLWFASGDAAVDLSGGFDPAVSGLDLVNSRMMPPVVSSRTRRAWRRFRLSSSARRQGRPDLRLSTDCPKRGGVAEAVGPPRPAIWTPRAPLETNLSNQFGTKTCFLNDPN